MTIKLTTEAELAKQLGWSEVKTAEKRRRERWPHISLGRFDKRYTDAQIEQIIAMHTVDPAAQEKPAQVLLTGQTERSRKRST